MTPEQEDLVQASFKKLLPVASEAATAFYDDLFARDPSLRPMFSSNIIAQGSKLMATLGTAVANLKSWDHIAAAVKALGARHVSYGVKPAHYVTVEASLITMLEGVLRDEFTPDLRQAWLACYRAVSAEMLAAPPSDTSFRHP